MRFNKFAENVSIHVTRPWFFALVTLSIVAWIPTLALMDPGISDLIVDSITNPISLLLLVLLHNSTFRSERASNERSDHLANALSLVLDQLAESEEDNERREHLRDRARELVRNAEEESAFEAGER